MQPTPPDLPPDDGKKLPGWLIALMVVVGVAVIAFGVCTVLITTSY